MLVIENKQFLTSINRRSIHFNVKSFFIMLVLYQLTSVNMFYIKILLNWFNLWEKILINKTFNFVLQTVNDYLLTGTKWEGRRLLLENENKIEEIMTFHLCIRQYDVTSNRYHFFILILRSFAHIPFDIIPLV